MDGERVIDAGIEVEDEFFAHNYLLVELPGTTPATTPQSRYARQLP